MEHQRSSRQFFSLLLLILSLVWQTSGQSTTTPAQKTGWYPEGCYTDAAAGRTLSVGMQVPGGSSTMTNVKCQDVCQAGGYVLAGTEYSGECFCDNQFRNNGGPAPDGNAQCSMFCNGNQTEVCGGSNRLTLFRYYTGAGSSSSPTVSSTTSSSAASSASTTSASSTAPVAIGLPKGFAYKGCFVDGPGYRIMNNQQPDDQSMTIASCANVCAEAGFEIAAMEYSSQCFCDNMVRMAGKLASSESECNTKCAGDQDQTCGGPARMSIYSSQTPLKVIKSPSPVQNVTDWTYQGCITDGGAANQVFPWKLVNSTGNSPEWCLGQCQSFGYQAAGMEYGEECYCGDLDGIEKTGSTSAPESDCNDPCPGDPEALCGAGNRLSWYKWEGEPLYVFQYPTGSAAGRYEFLVGGPIIPLIAQPGVNGKVSFLEKHGTGEPNTTGAYEFDPSIGGDIFHAFRELRGIKTDIFCAAGLTMPDRAGRQINIGGWSTDSLFGVRTYWPDGSAGVNGTNDWQEDVNTVKLQRGRWYPTGMVMANGSMLIVGGEDGSNGVPVPNMEILPTVGPVYEAQYLRDTDPYNLYPFLVVLPSGGIFIQYYNEARILDERSLDTVKILPQAPSTVNDPSGGRTYPLEGSQVLLPQYYPYDAPLEVLICGGAGRQPAWGVDNCISIEPDAAQPEWTLERMPSRRVMSCMATLPDGTYMIMNGAEIGAAGFGLADQSNLNAVLYDSTKPKHQRMSIMANTTIARMYHSEAVVMDDGRVLVSGSDPQDGVKHPQEHRLEVFLPPYLLSGAPQPTFDLLQNDWIWEADYSFTLTSSTGGGIKVSLLGAESSTHGSSMGARILFPQVSCSGNACTVKAPKGPYIAPVGWYRMFVLDGPTPSHAKWVRIGGDPAGLGNWPNAAAFQPLPGLGPVNVPGGSNVASRSTVARGFSA
ncbi:galactose oxidase [Clathrospora elynae]|uniref:Galactose oxidase n=1 Tax=Clathrospora elynae TaxID=706981 RepID=A0A6A5SHV9_9PLEO|nr:galactose oxidase [Clathrospora elynae]